ncbi:hypothetical protein M408DRAFT_317551 [Serendipita vermifera MAFF 305830]|uniref:PNPLA domain-containing protein n=1 Tax=Serendipita vermifera MAFF 305830 TaxID=933852 RepID=A0A0C3AZ71_SERVB|nr:hypothetical protein M408DRAFT_317551 [Serendipita vermifera MAFF 305830]
MRRQGNGLCLLSLGKLAVYWSSSFDTILDAGGSRGISQLKILAELKFRLVQEVRGDLLSRPHSIFDMIGGSGSGGFISILLGIFGLSVDETLEEFIILSIHVLDIPGISASARTERLKRYITDLMKKYEIDEEMRLLDPNPRSGRCKV